MLPNVYSLITGDATAAAIVGNHVYRHGMAPQDVALPYVTWFVPSAAMENTLSEQPKVDAYSVQVDVWSDSDAGVEHAAKAVRNAIEPHHHMTLVSNGRDPDTMRYRISMTFTFWTDRRSEERRVGKDWRARRWLCY